MKEKKVLHIVFPEKFFNDYIHFINKNFDPENHLFMYLKMAGDEPRYSNVVKLRFYRIPVFFHITLYKYFKKYDIIFLHSLSKTKVVNFLFLFPKFLRKSYWLLWGGDLYYKLDPIHNKKKKNIQNKIFSFVLKKLKFVLTHVKGDVEIAKKEFGFNGIHLECLLYPSNVINTSYHISKDENKKEVNILLGNSAHESNRHIDALNKLSKYKDLNIKIYCPLSYGDSTYAQKVITSGKEIFGGKFIPLLEFMPLAEYKSLLNNIDISIFNNWRQQGMGNIITLLAMGKTIYIRQETSTWDMLIEKGFKVKNFSLFESLETLTYEERLHNNKLALNIFSEERLVEQYKRIFNQNEI